MIHFQSSPSLSVLTLLHKKTFDIASPWWNPRPSRAHQPVQESRAQATCLHLLHKWIPILFVYRAIITFRFSQCKKRLEWTKGFIGAFQQLKTHSPCEIVNKRNKINTHPHRFRKHATNITIHKIERLFQRNTQK